VPSKTSFDFAAIVDLRKRLGWSQAAMASQIGVATNTLQRWESGESLPGGRQIALLLDVADENGQTDFELFVRPHRHPLGVAASRLDAALSAMRIPRLPYKDCFIGPLDRPLNLGVSADSLSEVLRAAAVEFRGFGGAEFPYGSINQFRDAQRKFIGPGELQLTDTMTWPWSTGDFNMWIFTAQGYLSHRSSLKEETMLLQAATWGRPQEPQTAMAGHIAVEWVLKDIVSAILFAARLGDVIGESGTLGVEFRWSGLQNRRMVGFPSGRYAHFGRRINEYVGTMETWTYRVALQDHRGPTDLAEDAARSCLSVFNVELSPSLSEDLHTLCTGELPR